jgi:hypothetical protein
MKIAVFWVVAPCSLVEVNNVSEVLAASIIRAIALMTSETLVNFYQTTQCYNPEDSHLRTHRRENLKSYLFFMFLIEWNFYKILYITRYGSMYIYIYMCVCVCVCVCSCVSSPSVWCRSRGTGRLEIKFPFYSAN